jgi:hypothetical protein
MGWETQGSRFQQGCSCCPFSDRAEKLVPGLCFFVTVGVVLLAAISYWCSVTLLSMHQMHATWELWTPCGSPGQSARCQSFWGLGWYTGQIGPRLVHGQSMPRVGFWVPGGVLESPGLSTHWARASGTMVNGSLMPLLLPLAPFSSAGKLGELLFSKVCPPGIMPDGSLDCHLASVCILLYGDCSWVPSIIISKRIWLNLW